MSNFRAILSFIKEANLEELYGKGQLPTITRSLQKQHSKTMDQWEKTPSSRKVTGKIKHIEASLDRARNIDARLGWQSIKAKGLKKIDTDRQDFVNYADKAAKSVKGLGKQYRKRAKKFAHYAKPPVPKRPHPSSSSWNNIDKPDK